MCIRDSLRAEAEEQRARKLREDATRRQEEADERERRNGADADEAEERSWEAVIKSGWDAWRKMGGSDRRARLKSAARRAEGAVTSSRQGRQSWIAAAKRHGETVAALEGVDGGDAAEKQRLRLEAHEVEAEASGSKRKWDNLKQKAAGAVTALGAELRAIGHM